MKTRVYFLQTERHGPIKVGIARVVASRIKTIQDYHPYPLVLLGDVPGARKHEAQIHRLLRDYRLRGEWFSAHADVLDLVYCVLGARSIEAGINRSAVRARAIRETTRTLTKRKLTPRVAMLVEMAQACAVIREAEKAA